MLGYESGIFDAIKGRREKELGKLAKILRLQVAVATLINATPPIMGVATFVAMSWLLGKPIDAATGFTTLTLLENLRFVLMQAPSAATFIITGYVSLQRVESFLDAPDVDQKPSSDGVKRGEVRVEDASFRWGGTADAAAATEENPLITESDPNERGLTLRGVDLRMRSLDDVVALGRRVQESGYKALKTNIFLWDRNPGLYMPGFARGGGGPELNVEKNIIDVNETRCVGEPFSRFCKFFSQVRSPLSVKMPILRRRSRK